MRDVDGSLSWDELGGFWLGVGFGREGMLDTVGAEPLPDCGSDGAECVVAFASGGVEDSDRSMTGGLDVCCRDSW